MYLKSVLKDFLIYCKVEQNDFYVSVHNVIYKKFEKFKIVFN